MESLSVSAAHYEAARPRQVTISFRIANIGRESITKKFRTTIFPGTVRADDVQPLAAYSVVSDGLAAGQSIYVSRTVVSPVSAFDVRIEADADHVIAEADEANNVATSTFSNPTSNVGRWVSIGPRRINNDSLGAIGRLSAIAIDPTSPGTIYVGANFSGAWKTGNGGVTWQPIADALPTLAVAALTVDPSSPARIYLATPGSGVYRSEDAGVSWTSISGNLNADVRWGVLLVHPTNSNIVFLNSADGIYRTRDFGATWQLVLRGRATATDLVMDRSQPNILYAAILGDGIYKTVDGGDSWTILAGGLPQSSSPDSIQQITLAICRDVPATLYAGYSRSSGLELYRTDTAGTSWSKQTRALRPVGAQHSALFNDVIGVDPSNPEYVYITGVDLYYSSDGGATFDWALSTPSGPHVDHHAFATDPVTPGVIYALSDGGIFRSPDRGRSSDQGGRWFFMGEGSRMLSSMTTQSRLPRQMWLSVALRIMERSNTTEAARSGITSSAAMAHWSISIPQMLKSSMV